MEVSIDVTHVGDFGDAPMKLVMNDVNKTKTVNMYLNGEHYRVNVTELERMVSAVK